MSELHDKFMDLFVNRDNPIILDLGTYRLEDISVFAQAIPNSVCYAFECCPTNIAAIKHEIYPKNIFLEHYAVGNTNDELDFYPSEKIDFSRPWNYSGSVRSPYIHLKEYTVSFGLPIKVQGIKLDTWCEMSGLSDKTIEFIQCDLNGNDGDMILGGEKTLQNTRLIYLEMFEKELYLGMKDKQWIHNALTDLGFELLFEHGHNGCYKNKKL